MDPTPPPPPAPITPPPPQPAPTPPPAQPAPPPAQPPPAPTEPTLPLSGSQLAQQQEADQHQHRLKTLLIAAVIAGVVLLIGAVIVIAAGSSILSNFGGKLEQTTFTEGSHTYSLTFYRNSTQEDPNKLSSLTQGGKKPLTSGSQLLVSPVLGKYGTGIAMFIVPYPAQQPFFPTGSCSDQKGFSPVGTVTMAADHSTAVICNLDLSDGLRGEYVFQFSQKGTSYVGFIQLYYDYNKVTSSPSVARDFVKQSSLAPYDSDLKKIISSIVASQ